MNKIVEGLKEAVSVAKGKAEPARVRTYKVHSPSLVKKRSVVIAGHKTSLGMEQPFWDAMIEIAAETGKTVHEIITQLDWDRTHKNLSSAVRLYALAFYRDKLKAFTND